jgi:hypothetical protein
MNQSFLLRLATIPAVTGSLLAMMFVSWAHGVESARLASRPTPAACSVPVGPLSRSPQAGALVASAGNAPIQLPAQNPPDDLALEFSYAESDAAVALFGCDCPACLNALRQLRNQPPAPQVLTSRRLGPGDPSGFANRALFASGRRAASRTAALQPGRPFASQPDATDPVQGHCWVNLQERATPEDIQNVLQTLEAQEAQAAKAAPDTRR